MLPILVRSLLRQSDQTRVLPESGSRFRKTRVHRFVAVLPLRPRTIFGVSFFVPFPYRVLLRLSSSRYGRMGSVNTYENDFHHGLLDLTIVPTFRMGFECQATEPIFGGHRPGQAPPNAAVAISTDRIFSTRRRLTARSLCPTRDAERTWITLSSRSSRKSTSSTNRKIRLRASACRYPPHSSTIVMRGKSLRTSPRLFQASSADPENRKGSIR